MFTSNTAEHDAANRRMLQKSAELKTLSAAFVATFVGSGIFRLRLRQSLRQRCKTITFATGSSLAKRRWRVMTGGMELDEVQQAAREQFARQSHRYGPGHILENIEDLRSAIEPLNLPHGAQVLDVATGAGHTGLFLAGLGHDVTLADIAQPMLDRAAKTAVERGLRVRTRLHPAEQFP